MILGCYLNCLFLAFITVPVCASDPGNEEGLYFITNYSRKDYAASTQNWAIVQDQRGVMYFGNNGGILEYDGVSWRKIHTTNRTTVRSLALDSSTGRIYVGAKGEIGYLGADSAGRLGFVSLTGKIPAGHPEFTDVWKTHVTKEGVFFQALTVILSYDPVTENIRVLKPKTRFHISFTADDTLYVILREIGFTRLTADSFQLIPGGEQFAKEPIMAMIPFPGQTGRQKYLLSTRSRGLYVYDGHSTIPFRTEADPLLTKSQIYHGTLTSNGHFALATLYNGVIIVDTNGYLVSILDKNSGLHNQSVRFVSTDRQGGLWLGLEDGIARAEVASAFTAYYEHMGLNGKVYSMVRHRESLYISTNLNVYEFTTGKKTSEGYILRNEFQPIPGISTMCWVLYSTGSSLFVTGTEGVYEIRNGKSSLIRKGITFTIQQSGKDTSIIYLGLKEGVAFLRYVNGHWTDGGNIANVNDEIRTLEEGKDGRLWAGTNYKGLLRLSPPPGWPEQKNDWRMERFGHEHGLPAGGVNAYSLSDRMVFSGRYGLFQYDEVHNQFKSDSSFGGLFSDTTAWVIQVAEDNKGTIWFATEKGNEYEFFPVFRKNDGKYEADKYLFKRFFDFSVLSIYPEASGVVWFGGPEGMIRFDSGIRRDYSRNYSALIRRVTVLQDSVIYGGAMYSGKDNRPQTLPVHVIPFHENTIRFEYAATEFDREKDNQYQCFLEGYDLTWQDWNQETKKDYAHIPEGHYLFHVRAKNIYGIISEEAVFEFTVMPPWFRTWWAYLIFGTLLFLVIWTIVYWRSRKLMRDKQKLESLVAQRTAELAQKEKQLEKIDLIVRAINAKIHIDEFLNSLINEIAFTDKIKNAAVLMYQAASGMYRFTFARGWNTDRLTQIEMTAGESEARYAPVSAQAAEDIFLIHREEPDTEDEKFAGFEPSLSMLVMRIRNQDAVSGYIIFDRMSDEEPFTAADVQLLSGLRQHILSGFTKAQLVTHLQHANEELKKLSDTKSEFLGIAAHDLRNPLNAIIGFIDLLIMDMKAGELNIQEAVTDLEMVLNSAKQMVGLISELLDISAIESGKVNLDLQRNNMNLIFEECERIHRKHAAQKNITLIIDKNAELPDVVIDKSRIAEVVDNLLSNAIKYTFPDGKVRLFAEVQPKEVCVHIQDSGQGLNENDMKQIFRSFKKLSARPTAGESSTGFGLAIVKKIVELHHGRVWVESRFNEGSTFSFSIPRPKE